MTDAIEHKDEVSASEAPLLDHLLELRTRLIRMCMALIVGCIICAPFLKQIISFLLYPFEAALVKYNVGLVEKGIEPIDLGLIATHPLETFFVKMKIALFGGVILAFPVIAYQVYRHFADLILCWRDFSVSLCFSFCHGICSQSAATCGGGND